MTGRRVGYMPPGLQQTARDMAAGRKAAPLVMGPRPLPHNPRGKDETPLTRAVIEAVNLTGRAHVHRVHSGKVKVKRGWMQLAPEGTPDIGGHARDGRAVYIETKRPGGAVRPAQAVFIKQAQDDGCVAFICDSVDGAVMHILREVQ